MARRYLLGGDGPEVRVPGRVAQVLWDLGLAAARDRLRRANLELDAETEDVLDAFEDAARSSMSQRSEFLGIPTIDDRDMVDAVTTQEAAKIIGTGPRNVTALAGRGTFGAGARKVGKRWTFERGAVETYAATRSD